MTGCVWLRCSSRDGEGLRMNVTGDDLLEGEGRALDLEPASLYRARHERRKGRVATTDLVENDGEILVVLTGIHPGAEDVHQGPANGTGVG